MSGKEPHRKRLISGRYIIGLALILLAGAALAAGGALSPLLLLAAGVAALGWPLLSPRLPIGEVVPVSDSVLLRSRYFPFAWHAVAELKPGADPFPRAASSFEGRLSVFTGTGRSYFLITCTAIGRGDAESKLLHALRSASTHRSGGAFLLPLDSTSASEVFRLRLAHSNLPEGPLADSASMVSGILLLDCSRGSVQRAGAYEVVGPAQSSTIPSGSSALESAPLVWEVFESLGRRTSWPDPDAVSNLLDSLAATKGVPFGERIGGLEGSGADLKVRSLAGDELRLSRPQMRAIVSIYS